MDLGFSRIKTIKTDEDKKQMREAAYALVEHLGGLRAASINLGVKFQVLQGWRTRGQIPMYQAERIADQYAKDGFTFEYMRPDVRK